MEDAAGSDEDDDDVFKVISPTAAQKFGKLTRYL